MTGYSCISSIIASVSIRVPGVRTWAFEADPDAALRGLAEPVPIAVLWG